MKIKELYAKEERDPVSIRIWLKIHGYSEKAIDLALAEFAQKIADGDTFGYVKGISVLSNKIRERTKELNMKEEREIMTQLGNFTKKESRMKRLWAWLSRDLHF